MINMVKLPTSKSELFLRVAKGHFATSHSHINYYIDVTTQKSRLSEAKAVAKELVAAYQHSTIVDTVLCLDGTQVIGTCLARELTQAGYCSINEERDICILRAEVNADGKILFRDNARFMIEGKNVLILAASLTTGGTARRGMECIRYYGGTVAGIAAIYSHRTELDGILVSALFDCADLPDYASYPAEACPLCRRGIPLDAVVNSFGYSKV